MKNKLNLMLFLITLTTGANSFGQAGTHGGDPNELGELRGVNGVALASWTSVRNDLILGLKQNRHFELQLGSYTREEFKTDVLYALENAVIIWDQIPVKVNGVPRACENFTSKEGQQIIHCNQDAYALALSHYGPETQYQFIAHEYFSIAKKEPSLGNGSDYSISTQIGASLSEVTFMRWATAVHGFPGISCSVDSFFNHFKIQFMKDKGRIVASRVLSWAPGSYYVIRRIYQLHHIMNSDDIQRYAQGTLTPEDSLLKGSINFSLNSGVLKIEDENHKLTTLNLVCEKVNFTDQDFNRGPNTFEGNSSIEKPVLLKYILRWISKFNLGH